MSQQINLFNPALVEKSDPPTLAALVQISSVLIIGLILLIAYYKWQAIALSQQHDALEATIAHSQVQLNNLNNKLSVRQPNIDIITQIVAGTKKREEIKNLVNLFSMSNSAAVKTFSDYMQGFADQKLLGLWLTGFTIDSVANQFTIKGRALKAETVPEYITQLGEHQVFKGIGFESLNMGAVTIAPVNTTPQIMTVSADKNISDKTTSDKTTSDKTYSDKTVSTTTANTLAASNKTTNLATKDLIDFVLISDKNHIGHQQHKSLEGEEL